MLLRHTSNVNIPVDRNFPPVKQVAKQSEFQLFPPVHNSTNVNAGSTTQRSRTQSAGPVVNQLC